MNISSGNATVMRAQPILRNSFIAATNFRTALRFWWDKRYKYSLYYNGWGG
jgi:hypothetical protein